MIKFLNTIDDVYKIILHLRYRKNWQNSIHTKYKNNYTITCIMT